MNDAEQSMLRYRVLRYMPNLVRGEWVNIGIILEDLSKQIARARVIEEDVEFVRIRRLHPNVDETILRSLQAYFQNELAATGASTAWLEKIAGNFSTTVQLSESTAVPSDNFDLTMEQLYRDKVAILPGPGRGAAILENTRVWIRMKLNDVFRRHRVLTRMEKGIRAEQFTQPGDPMRIDYGYRYNGTRGYVQALSLARDPAQAKVLAYTAECIRARQPNSEFTAITEVAPLPQNPRHQFIVRLFDEQEISVVPLPQVEAFAERLRLRLQ